MLKKNNLFLRVLLISLCFNILTPADNDAPFGDVLLHHVTNDKSHVYIPLEIGGIDLSITKHKYPFTVKSLPFLPSTLKSLTQLSQNFQINLG